MVFKNLVFQGGGFAGVAYVGAIKKLESLEQEGKFSFKQLERVAGTSVGALTAMLVALGYTADEIYEKTLALSLDSLKSGGCGIIGNLVRLNKNYGIYHPDNLLKFIRECIEEKTGNKNATFGDFKKMGFKDLYVVATKVYLRDTQSTCKAVSFSHENAFDTPVAEAVLASACFPGLFGCVRLEEVRPGFYKMTQSNKANAYIDGGLLDNLPEELFDQTRYIENEKEKKVETILNPETLSLLLVDKITLDEITENKTIDAPLPLGAPIAYLSALVNGCTLDQQNNLLRKNQGANRSIFIDRLGVSTIANLDATTKKKLIASGDLAVAKFFGVAPTPAQTASSIAEEFAKKRAYPGFLQRKPLAPQSIETAPKTHQPKACTIL